MSLSWWRKFVEKQSPRNSTQRSVPKIVRLLARLELELLEDRIVPATYQWTGGGSTANWNDAGNWTGGASFPNAVDDVAQFHQTSDYTAAQSVSVNVPITVGEIDFGTAKDVSIGGS